MLLEQQTLEQFGYTIETLSNGSSKKVVIQCDYCQHIYNNLYKQYIKARNIVEKDACCQCKYQKRKDVSLALYGVANSSQRPNVRKKISENCEGFDDKRRATMKQKYGTENAMQHAELKEHNRQAILDKYGVENVSQAVEVRKRMEQTNLKKYGNKQFLGSNIGRYKVKDGMLTKYGVENAFQSEEIKQQIRATNLVNLGVEMPTQSPIIMAKIEQTNLDRYGCKNPAQNTEVKQKIIATNIERYGCTNPQQNVEIKQQIRQSAIDSGRLKIYNGKDMKTIAQEYEIPYSTFMYHSRIYGIETAIKMVPQISALEQIIKVWLDESNISYKQQFVIQNKRADFLLTDHNIILEIDGLYWHSDLVLEDDYHIKKRQLYIDNGYIPLFFRENEIHNKLDIVRSIILNKMGKSNSVFARKCEIVSVSRQDSHKFFEDNHLMGDGRGITYGLQYNGELISCIIIRRTIGQNWEISRFCNKLGYQVVGGFSRLIKHFLKNNIANLLTTFIDQRYGMGLYLIDLGFKFMSCSPSFRWTDTKECVHRMKFRGNSGYDNGFIKIWDCGQARYDLTIIKS